MSYLIDREKVVAQIEETYCEECETKGNPYKCQPCFVFDFIHSWLGRREDVVRCKDCLWRGDDEYCDKHGFQNATDEFFCASGRKEQEDE